MCYFVKVATYVAQRVYAGRVHNMLSGSILCRLCAHVALLWSILCSRRIVALRRLITCTKTAIFYNKLELSYSDIIEGPA